MNKRLEEYLLRGAPEGQRNNALFEAILMAREDGWSELDVHRAMQERGAADGLSASEIKTTLASAYRHEITPRENIQKRTGRKYDWDSIIGGSADAPGVAHAPSELPTIPPPHETWKQTDLSRFLAALFRADEKVRYVTEGYQDDDGTWKPKKGVYFRTAEAVMAESLTAMGVPYKDAIGAWVCLNPLDGNGVSDENVISYRHCLLEFDDIPLEEQLGHVLQSRVPCATIVHSGKKSIHAAIKVNANTRKEFDDRVKFLYDYFGDKGAKPDRQCKNPSRLSRLPGVTRNGQPQYLLGVDCGAATWEEWKASIAMTPKDGLPSIWIAREFLAAPPPLLPEVIHGVLRQSHKMLLAGPSKMGKTFMLLNLACCVTQGKPWLGFPTAKHRILYIDFEVDRGSFAKRLTDVSAHTGIDLDYFHGWNLRSKAAPITELSGALLARIENGKYGMIVLDPLYKLLTGDENSAKDMAEFCGQLDQLATETGASIVISSHFSKGNQWEKTSIDRTSGSGVLGRDPDAVCTLTPIPKSDSLSLEFTLRDFRSPPSVGVTWNHPVHALDLTAPTPPPSGQAATAAPKANSKQMKVSNLISAVQYLAQANGTSNNCADIADVIAFVKKGERTVLGWVKENPDKFQARDGKIYVINNGD